MKRKLNLRHLLLLIVLCITASETYAQSRQHYLPENGFYVLVSNKNNKYDTLVQFYTDDQQLIYEETVHAKNFNLNKKKVLRCLNFCLTKALLAWNYKKEVLRDKNWLASTLHK
jgi:hypothetical protein